MLRTEIKNTILAITVSVVAIFVPALILNKWIEGILFFFCHWLVREQFPEQYHHIVPAMCRLLTSIIFFLSVSFILPLSISFISVLPITYVISWVGCIKKQRDIYEVKYNRLKSKVVKLTQFNTDTCNKEQLIKRCEELHISKYNTELAIEFFIYKTKQSLLADKLCIDEKSVQKHKQRLKNKLNNL